MRTDRRDRRGWFGRRRAGSVSIEVALLMPVIVLMMFAARYVSQTMELRNINQATVRSATWQATFSNWRPSAPLGCMTPTDYIDNATGPINRSVVGIPGLGLGPLCVSTAAEDGVQTEFFDMLAQHENVVPGGLLRDVRPDERLFDIESYSSTQLEVERPSQLRRLDESTQVTQYRLPGRDTFRFKSDTPWRAGYDPVLHDALSPRTIRLFPNVFPAADD